MYSILCVLYRTYGRTIHDDTRDDIKHEFCNKKKMFLFFLFFYILNFSCNTTCPEGFYGMMCRKTCTCGPNNKCNPFNGTCLNTNVGGQYRDALTDGDRISPVVHLESANIPRIEVYNWRRVNQTIKFENVTSLAATNHTIILNALNSSLANLTENIEKLSKKVDEQNEKETDPIAGQEELSLFVEQIDLETTAKNDVHLILGQTIYDSAPLETVTADLEESPSKQTHPPVTALIILCLLIITILLVVRITKSLKALQKKRKQFADNLRVVEGLQPPSATSTVPTDVITTQDHLCQILHLKPTRPRKKHTMMVMNSSKRINKPLPGKELF